VTIGPAAGYPVPVILRTGTMMGIFFILLLFSGLLMWLYSTLAGLYVTSSYAPSIVGLYVNGIPSGGQAVVLNSLSDYTTFLSSYIGTFGTKARSVRLSMNSPL